MCIKSSDYDQQVEAIRAYNQPILDTFQAWLTETGLADKTVRSHVENISFFTEYLVYYEPLKRLDEAGAGDVDTFLTSWFPRKAMWASESSIKSNIASFKKFFQWIGKTGRVSTKTTTEVLTMLKENRDEFLRAVEEYEKSLDEWDDS
ncbi:MAG: site-specific integrase [Chloroflexota bacterium]